MVLISLASGAISNLGTFEQDTCVELPQICKDCTYNNISKILYPNSTIIVENVVMTKDDTYYNYTFCSTDALGTYTINGFGDPAGTKTTWNYIFEVTPTGKSATTYSSIISGLILLVMFGTAIFFMIFAKTTEQPGVKLFFNMISFVVMILMVGTGVIILRNENLTTLIKSLLFIIAIVFIIAMYYIFTNMTKTALALWKAKRGFGSELDNTAPF